MIGGCQTNVEWILDRIQWSGARCDAVGPVSGSSPLAIGHTDPKGSTVVQRWISMCNVTEELKAGDIDDVCEWWCTALSLKYFYHQFPRDRRQSYYTFSTN